MSSHLLAVKTGVTAALYFLVPMILKRRAGKVSF